jgi:hypothetical protein
MLWRNGMSSIYHGTFSINMIYIYIYIMVYHLFLWAIFGMLSNQSVNSYGRLWKNSGWNGRWQNWLAHKYRPIFGMSYFFHFFRWGSTPGTLVNTKMLCKIHVHLIQLRFNSEILRAYSGKLLFYVVSGTVHTHIFYSYILICWQFLEGHSFL